MLKKIRSTIQPKTGRPYHLFQIEPTLFCNLDCVMCPWVEHRLVGGTMNRETFERIASHLHLAEEVDLTGGGEPLLSSLLPEMVKTIKQAGCKVGFSTNGTLLDANLAERLVRLGLDWISFSVDAASASTYESIRRGASFDQVMANISTLSQIKSRLASPTPRMMMVFVMMTGETENFHQLPEFIDLAHRLGVEQVIAKNLDVILKDGDDQRRLFAHQGNAYPPLVEVLRLAQQRALELGIKLRQYSLHPSEQIVCEQNPIQNLFFSWDGSVSPCITLSYTESRIFAGARAQVPVRRFGNINQTTLEEIWNQPYYCAFRKTYENRLLFQRQSLIDALLGGDTLNGEIPAAPAVCQTCYYLYGI